MLNLYTLHNRKEKLDYYLDYNRLLCQLEDGLVPDDLSLILPIIKKDPYYAYYYAKWVIGGRWIEAEGIIMRMSNSAYLYAHDILKRRWIEAEPIIMMDSEFAYWYASYIIKDRWIEAEPIIEGNAHYWDCYCLRFSL